MQKIKNKMINYAGNVNIVDNWDLNIKVFNFIIFAFLFVVALYILLLATIFSDLSDRKRLDTLAYNLSNDISILENEYLNNTNNIDLGLSKEMGFKEVKPKFVSRNGFLDRVSVVINEN